jgi:hypothetical protein
VGELGEENLSTSMRKVAEILKRKRNISKNFSLKEFSRCLTILKAQG